MANNKEERVRKIPGLGASISEPLSRVGSTIRKAATSGKGYKPKKVGIIGSQGLPADPTVDRRESGVTNVGTFASSMKQRLAGGAGGVGAATAAQSVDSSGVTGASGVANQSEYVAPTLGSVMKDVKGFRDKYASVDRDKDTLQALSTLGTRPASPGDPNSPQGSFNQGGSRISVPSIGSVNTPNAGASLPQETLSRLRAVREQNQGSLGNTGQYNTAAEEAAPTVYETELADRNQRVTDNVFIDDVKRMIRSGRINNKDGMKAITTLLGNRQKVDIGNRKLDIESRKADDALALGSEKNADERESLRVEKEIADGKLGSASKKLLLDQANKDRSFGLSSDKFGLSVSKENRQANKDSYDLYLRERGLDIKEEGLGISQQNADVKQRTAVANAFKSAIEGTGTIQSARNYAKETIGEGRAMAMDPELADLATILQRPDLDPSDRIKLQQRLRQKAIRLGYTE